MSSSTAVERPAATALGRLVSLDVLRGATIAFMILVNNSGDRAYRPLQHSDWNGWTPTDLVFPVFLFLMGAVVILVLLVLIVNRAFSIRYPFWSPPKPTSTARS